MVSGIGKRLELRGLRSGILGLLMMMMMMMGRRWRVVVVGGVGVGRGRFGGEGGSSGLVFVSC